MSNQIIWRVRQKCCSTGIPQAMTLFLGAVEEESFFVFAEHLSWTHTRFWFLEPFQFAVESVVTGVLSGGLSALTWNSSHRIVAQLANCHMVDLAGSTRGVRLLLLYWFFYKGIVLFFVWLLHGSSRLGASGVALAVRSPGPPVTPKPIQQLKDRYRSYKSRCIVFLLSLAEEFGWPHQCLSYSGEGDCQIVNDLS